MIKMYVIELKDGEELPCDVCDKITKRTLCIKEKGHMAIAICEKCLRKGLKMLEKLKTKD